MLVWILLVAQVAIYLVSRFLIKNKIVKKILFLASIGLIAIWTVDYSIPIRTARFFGTFLSLFTAIKALHSLD